MSVPSGRDVKNRADELNRCLRLFVTLYERLHELAYERGSTAGEKIRVPMADPTGDLVADEAAGMSRESLRFAASKLLEAEKAVGSAINRMSESLKASSPGLPTRGVTRYSEADVHAIEREQQHASNPELTERRHWDRKRWPRRETA